MSLFKRINARSVCVNAPRHWGVCGDCLSSVATQRLESDMICFRGISDDDDDDDDHDDHDEYEYEYECEYEYEYEYES